MTHTFNLSTWEEETDKSLSWRLAWSTVFQRNLVWGLGGGGGEQTIAGLVGGSAGKGTYFKPGDWSWIPGTACWKEGTDPHKLSSDVHMDAVYTHLHMHT